jgi:predicted aspartyl protease
LLVCFLVITNYIYAQKTIEKIKLNVVNNNLYVQVKINNKGPFNFLYDTGASGEGRIDQRVAKELDLKVVDSVKNYDGSGNFKLEPVVEVSTICLGNKLKKENIALICRNYNANLKKDGILTDGIIGADFLNDYLITIDCTNKELVAAVGSLTIKRKGVLKYQQKNEIKGSIGRIDTVFHIDTGSALSLHLPESFIKKFDYENTAEKMVARKSYTTYVIQHAILKDEISISNVKARNIDVVYSDKATYINVGIGFLKHYKLTIDKKNKLILIR